MRRLSSFGSAMRTLPSLVARSTSGKMLRIRPAM
jgi:hypothetical protein